MLLGKVEVTTSRGTLLEYQFFGKINQTMLYRLVAKDGKSAVALMGNVENMNERVNRMVSVNSSKILIEKIGSDTAKDYQSSFSYKLLMGVSSILKYVMGISELSNDYAEGFIGRATEELEVSYNKVFYFETDYFKGSYRKDYGGLLDLEVSSKEGISPLNVRLSLHYDDTFMIKPVQERISLMGSALLNTGKEKSFYTYIIPAKVWDECVGVYKAPKVELGFEGISTNPSSLFYETIDELERGVALARRREYEESQLGKGSSKGSVKSYEPLEIEWVKEKVRTGKYQIVKPDKVEEVFAQLEKDYQECYQVLGLDTETNTLNFNFKTVNSKEARITGLVLSARVGTSYYFPLSHKRFENVCNGDVQYFMDAYVKPFLKGKDCILSNNEFDWRVMYAYGVTYKCIFDTQIFMESTFQPKYGMNTGLKDTTKAFLKREAFELNDVVKVGNYNDLEGKATFEDMSEEIVAHYACPDADNTLSLYIYWLTKGVIQEYNAGLSVMNKSRFTSVLAYSKYYGSPLDLEGMVEARRSYELERAGYMKDLFEFVAFNFPDIPLRSDKVMEYMRIDDGVPYEEKVFKTSFFDMGVPFATKNAYSVSSTKFNPEIAYKRLGYPEVRKQDTGNLTTGKDASKRLGSYRLEGKKNFSISSQVLEKEMLSNHERFGHLKPFISSSISILRAVESSLPKRYRADFKLSDFEGNKGRCSDIAFKVRQFRGSVKSNSIKENAEHTEGVIKRYVRLTSEQAEVLRIVAKARYGLDYGWFLHFRVSYSGQLVILPANGSPLYVFIEMIKKASDVNLLFTNLFDKVGEHYTPDGFCFPNFKALVTGRISTSSPNIQGYDDRIKQLVRARKGYYTVDTDYSSKENRVIAIATQERSLLEIFSNSRNDYHRNQAATLNGTIPELVDDKMRKLNKATVFAINFGQEDSSLAIALFGDDSPENVKKAKERRELFFALQPNVRDWFNNNVKTAYEKGYSETIMGSRRYYDATKKSRSQIRRYALNHPIQGSAADIYKKGMVDLLDDIIENGYLGKILLTGFIHDEATLEVHKSVHPHIVLGLLRRNLMVKIKNGCPLDIGFGVGRSWYEAKKTEWQVALQEKLEWRTELYAWDGDIDKYSEWAKEQIHLHNGSDTAEYISNANFDENTPIKDKVFNVAYSLELNSYIEGEMERMDNLRKVIPKAPQFASSKDKSSFIYKYVTQADIDERLRIFDYFHKIERLDWKGLFIDVNLLQDLIKEEQAQKANAEDSAERAFAREREKIAEQVIDFGSYYVSSENKLYILYHAVMFQAIAQYLVPVSSVSESERVSYLDLVFYNHIADVFKDYEGYVLPKSCLQNVSGVARQYSI